MSRPLKKQRAVFPIEEPPSDESCESEEEHVDEIIQVEFEAFKSEDTDFDGIKSLLQQSLRGLNIDTSALANVIISQNYVGSVIRQAPHNENALEDDDDDNDGDEVFGVSTVINLTSRKDEAPISQLRSALVEKCNSWGNDSVNQLLRDNLAHDGKHVGLLISERLINLPPQLAIPTFESLMKELDEAIKKEMPYKFAFYILISKLHKLKANKKKKKKKSERMEQVVWSNAEEEIFFENSEASFDYSLEGEAVKDDWHQSNIIYVPWRRVMLIPAFKLPFIVNKIKEEVTPS